MDNNDVDYISIVAANIRHLRNYNDFTQIELARRVNMDRSVISRLESGKGNPNIRQLEIIAPALNTSVSSLLSVEYLQPDFCGPSLSDTH